MNIFYLFGGLLMLIFGAGAIGSGVILLFGLLTKNAVRKVCLSLGGLGMVGSVVALGLVAGCNHLLWAPSTDPIAVYRGAFNSAPPASVTNLQGKFSSGPDCGFRYVQFTTDEATFRSLLPKQLSRNDANSPRPHEPPTWWTPAVPGQTEFYPHSGDSMSETTLMTWNPKTGVVQFYWQAID